MLARILALLLWTIPTALLAGEVPGFRSTGLEGLCFRVRQRLAAQTSEVFRAFFHEGRKGTCGPSCVINGAAGVEELLNLPRTTPVERMATMAGVYRDLHDKAVSVGSNPAELSEAAPEFFSRMYGIRLAEAKYYELEGTGVPLERLLERPEGQVTVVAVRKIDSYGLSQGGHFIEVVGVDRATQRIAFLDPNNPSRDDPGILSYRVEGNRIVVESEDLEYMLREGLLRLEVGGMVTLRLPKVALDKARGAPKSLDDVKLPPAAMPSSSPKASAPRAKAAPRARASGRAQRLLDSFDVLDRWNGLLAERKVDGLIEVVEESFFSEANGVLTDPETGESYSALQFEIAVDRLEEWTIFMLASTKAATIRDDEAGVTYTREELTRLRWVLTQWRIS
jgi:hypothetical protein